MKGALAAISGLTIGAVTMFFLDPNRGRSRRTSVFDQTTQLSQLGRKAAGRTIRRVGHRLSGLNQSLRSWTGRNGVGSGLGKVGTKLRTSKAGRAARRLKIA
jgi:hypothetical protein